MNGRRAWSNVRGLGQFDEGTGVYAPGIITATPPSLPEIMTTGTPGLIPQQTQILGISVPATTPNQAITAAGGTPISASTGMPSCALDSLLGPELRIDPSTGNVINCNCLSNWLAGPCQPWSPGTPVSPGSTSIQAGTTIPQTCNGLVDLMNNPTCTVAQAFGFGSGGNFLAGAGTLLVVLLLGGLVIMRLT